MLTAQCHVCHVKSRRASIGAGFGDMALVRRHHVDTMFRPPMPCRSRAGVFLELRRRMQCRHMRIT